MQSLQNKQNSDSTEILHLMKVYYISANYFAAHTGTNSTQHMCVGRPKEDMITPATRDEAVGNGLSSVCAHPRLLISREESNLYSLGVLSTFYCVALTVCTNRKKMLSAKCQVL